MSTLSRLQLAAHSESAPTSPGSPPPAAAAAGRSRPRLAELDDHLGRPGHGVVVRLAEGGQVVRLGDGGEVRRARRRARRRGCGPRGRSGRAGRAVSRSSNGRPSSSCGSGVCRSASAIEKSPTVKPRSSSAAGCGDVRASRTGARAPARSPAARAAGRGRPASMSSIVQRRTVRPPSSESAWRIERTRLRGATWAELASRRSLWLRAPRRG